MTTTEQINESLSRQILPYVEEDNPKHRTHVVNLHNNLHIWQPGMKSQDVVDIARLTGQEVVALCGYRWVPIHNPARYKACKQCIDIAVEIVQSL